MTREEVAALAPERSRVIEVEQFVDVAAVDPIYFESRYYVVPDREWSPHFASFATRWRPGTGWRLRGSRCGRVAT